jgi:tRNA-dihydrouridine synthase 3
LILFLYLLFLSLIQIHGRSRLQRYSKLANWDYVLQCARSQDPMKPLVPIIGNGDIFSWEDWKDHQNMIESNLLNSDEDENSLLKLCSCAMLGRGSLIKPWLPQEIKEQRVVDISASERLDMLKRFCDYGMEHWGSDQQGIDTTRRFLLEWCSFLYRYVPAGITERVQRMNQRPPMYIGRSDTETLLSSPDSRDWIRISEMFLGKISDSFVFIPKHKSNAWENVTNQTEG